MSLSSSVHHPLFAK